MQKLLSASNTFAMCFIVVKCLRLRFTLLRRFHHPGFYTGQSVRYVRKPQTLTPLNSLTVFERKTPSMTFLVSILCKLLWPSNHKHSYCWSKMPSTSSRAVYTGDCVKKKKTTTTTNKQTNMAIFMIRTIPPG